MLLSVVIIGRNDVQHISRSIGTALRTRSEGDVEVIFVYDASTDATLSTAQKLCDGKQDTKVLHSDVHVSAGGARNIGVREASGDYIYFHDSDDYLSEDGLDRLVKAIKENKFPDVILVPFQVLRTTRYENHVPDTYKELSDTVGWAVGPWSAAF